MATMAAVAKLALALPEVTEGERFRRRTWFVAGKAFVAGGRFSAADVYVASQIGWGMQFGSIDRRPAFTAYCEALSSRPAAQRAREIDDGLISAQAT